MKRKLMILVFAGLLVGCSDDKNDVRVTESVADTPEAVSKAPHDPNAFQNAVSALVAQQAVVEALEEGVEEVAAEEVAPGIDTSVFEYARNVDVVDARDINNHLTLTVWMSEELADGLASNQVLNQTWDFIQQEDVVGADTITIGVMSGDKRVFQFTLTVAAFSPTEDGAMVDEVLAAATVDKASTDVLAFAEAFEWRIVK